MFTEKLQLCKTRLGMGGLRVQTLAGIWGFLMVFFVNWGPRSLPGIKPLTGQSLRSNSLLSDVLLG